MKHRDRTQQHRCNEALCFHGAHSARASVTSKAICDQPGRGNDERRDSCDDDVAHRSIAPLQEPLQLLQMRRTGFEPLTIVQHDDGIVLAIRDELAHAPEVHQA